MLRRIHDPQRGATLVEYAAVIILVAAVSGALLGSGLIGAVTSGVTGAVDELMSAGGPGTEPDDPQSPGEPGAPPAPESQPAPQANPPDSGGGGGRTTTADSNGSGPDVAPASKVPQGGPAGNDPQQLTNANKNAQPSGFWDQVGDFGETIGDQAGEAGKQAGKKAANGWNDFWAGPTDYASKKASETWSSLEKMDDDLRKQVAPYKKIARERFARGEYVRSFGGYAYDYWGTVGTGIAQAEYNAIFDENYWKAEKEGRDGDALAYALWNGVAGHLSPGRYGKLIKGAAGGNKTPGPSVRAGGKSEPKGEKKDEGPADPDQDEKKEDPDSRDGASCPRTDPTLIRETGFNRSQISSALAPPAEAAVSFTPASQKNKGPQNQETCPKKGNPKVQTPKAGERPRKIPNNSDKLNHASRRAVERDPENYNNSNDALSDLKNLSSSIEKNGWPEGSIPDSKYSDRMLVPFTENTYAVYQIKPNGNATLNTILTKKDE